MAKQRQITALTGSPAELLPALAAVRAQDHAADRDRGRVRAKGGLFLGLGCVGFVGAFVLMGFLPVLGVPLLITCVVLLVLGIVHQVRAGQLAALDLDNERLALVNELIEVLTPDLSDKKPLTLSLRHGVAVNWAPPTGQRTEGTWLSGRTNFSEYEDTWLNLGGRMQDGSLFKLAVTECVKRKSKPKRKYTKQTDRCREKVTLVLRVSPAFYPHLERLQVSLHPDRLLAGAGLSVTQLQVNGPSIRIQAITGINTRQVLRYSRPETGQEHRVQANKVIGLLAFMFAGLSFCRMDAEPETPAQTGVAASAPGPEAGPAATPPAPAG